MSIHTEVTDAARIDGLNHLAVTTPDLDRFVAFWAETCALVFHPEAEGAPFRHGMLGTATTPLIHVFELGEQVTGPVEVAPMFRRGRLDHFGLNAPDEHALRAIRDRLVAVGASDGTVTLFGALPGLSESLLSVHVVDPDGGQSEVCCIRTGVSFSDDEVTPFAPPTDAELGFEPASAVTGPR